MQPCDAMKITLNEVMTIMSIATWGEVFIQFGRKTKLEKKSAACKS